MYQSIKKVLEQCGILFCTIMISEYLGNAFSVVFEGLGGRFPPPGEAPGHEERMATTNAVFDRVEEYSLQVVGELGVSNRRLQSLTGSLKSGVKHVVTIGDFMEQHTYLAQLPGIAISIMVLLSQGFLAMILQIVKGKIFTWLLWYLIGLVVPKRR
ncbi:uncharacterized protein HD556DRAFT_1418814 [Suillus plorans]|uniref:Uncharacterized protein n=1 Tax=Suillus plorans TaxID=116603 RepID=A0A9P7ABG1_9AGAM|nr:uncharacterized protein HD556DRAFT_1418814 [Suillus plorans]KAG1785917.1 hypothetical protein HD556DRAFT_1418814 [Suillus plorans]